MIDRIGHKLEVGDIVVMPNRHGYVDLQIGRVVGFTPKFVKTIQFKDGDRRDGWNNREKPRMVQYTGVVAITGEDALAYVLKNG